MRVRGLSALGRLWGRSLLTVLPLRGAATSSAQPNRARDKTDSHLAASPNVPSYEVSLSVSRCVVYLNYCVFFKGTILDSIAQFRQRLTIIQDFISISPSSPFHSAYSGCDAITVTLAHTVGSK